MTGLRSEYDARRAEHGVTNHLRNCIFFEEERDLFVSALATRIESGTAREPSDCFTSSPFCLEVNECKLLEDIVAELSDPPLSPMPWWLSQVANFRDSFDDVALVDDDATDGKIYVFLFAKQRPRATAWFVASRLLKKTLA